MQSELVFPIAYLFIFCFVNYVLEVINLKRRYLAELPISILTFIFFVFYLSNAPQGWFSDFKSYDYAFNYIKENSLFTALEHLRFETGFIILSKLISLIAYDSKEYYIVLHVFQSLLWLICFSLWSKDGRIGYTVLVFSSMFVFYNLYGNIIRQGVAIPISLIGVYFALSGKKAFTFFFMVLGVSMHLSVAIYFLALLPLFFVKDVKFYLFGIVVLSLFSYLGLFSALISVFFSFTNIYSHLVSEKAYEVYRIGFRLDFFVFSLIPVLFYLLLDELHKYDNRDLIRLYLVLFGMFIVSFDMPYSDRIGLFCWVLFPIILGQGLGRSRFSIVNVKLFHYTLVFIAGSIQFIYVGLMNYGINIL